MQIPTWDKNRNEQKKQTYMYLLAFFYPQSGTRKEKYDWR